MRLAARPVGAHRRSLAPLAARIRRIPLTMVVMARVRAAAAITTQVRILAGTSSNDTSRRPAGISICRRGGNIGSLRSPIAVDTPVIEASQKLGSKKIRMRSWSLAPAFKMPGTPRRRKDAPRYTWLRQAGRHYASIWLINVREQSSRYQRCTREVPRCLRNRLICGNLRGYPIFCRG